MKNYIPEAKFVDGHYHNEGLIVHYVSVWKLVYLRGGGLYLKPKAWDIIPLEDKQIIPTDAYNILHADG